MPFSTARSLLPALLLLVAASALALTGCDSGGGDDGGDLGAETVLSFSNATARDTASEASGDELTLSVEVADPGFKEVSVDVVFDEANSTLSRGELSGFPEGDLTLTFPENATDSTTQSFSFSVNDDDEPGEGPETAVFRLANPNGGALGARTSFTLVVNDDETTLLTISEARGMDDGARVTVTGILTGADGSAVRIQQDGGPTGTTAIVVDAGALADALDSGALSLGDRIQVTGTLGTDAGLRQLSGVSFSLVEAGVDVPGAQTPTVSELSMNGEDYESELVSVDGLSVDGSGTFLAGGAEGNYDATGPGGGTITLRIPGGSFFEDQPVPQGPADFTGFVGEFNGSYQLLAVNAGDLTVTRQGVVTRTGGNRAWIEYTTGDGATEGLVVRGEDLGADLSSGAVSSGDRLEASGTLTSMDGGSPALSRGLAYSVVEEDAGVPAPQMPTLEMLAGSPVEYESELIRVEGLTIDGSGSFEAGTNYPVISGEGTFFSLRVDSLSFYAGEPIPSGSFNFEGVVGRVDGRFRLLALEEGDVASPAQDAITIAEVRNADIGTNVTTTGVFTRIEGSNARIQDTSGPTGASGIVVRADALEEAVANGDVEAGDRLLVSGPVDEFNELLQLNDDSDAGSVSFEVIEEGAGLPDAQAVTVGEIATSGEDYESELVHIEGLTIDPDSDSDGDGIFNGGGAEGNYLANGPDGNAITLRIPGDSFYAGQPIPEGAVTFEGVLGQFGTGDPASGYQLLAILDGAIQPGN